MKKSTYIPLLLTIYLGVRSNIGATLLCIVLLHFFLKKRDKLAQERKDDMNKSR